jgi:hypothetical protein
VCDFREETVLNGDRFFERAAQLGEIYVAPVAARYTTDGRRDCAVFWVVMFRPKRCFDVVGHIVDIVTAYDKESSPTKRKLSPNKDMDKIIETMRKIMLHQYKWSPSAHEYLVKESNAHIDPFERLQNYSSPDSMDSSCNIYESFRGILKSLGHGNV